MTAGRHTAARSIDDSRHDSVVHRAKWIVCDPWTVIPDGYVHIEQGEIREAGRGNFRGQVSMTDHGEGVIFPQTVNAHTHLELSALKGCLDTGRGFDVWVRDLLCKRDQMEIQTLVDMAEAETLKLIGSGCGAVGEISTLGITRDIVRDSGLAGVWFREFLGDQLPDTAIPVKTGTDLSMSMAGHAPHTTSPDVLTAIKNSTRLQGLPFSLHLAESLDEVHFLETASGPWKDFLVSRGINPASWGLPATSPVRYVNDMGILDHRTILVHLLHADDTDMEIVSRSGAYVCICPRSSQTIHQRLPNLEKMLKAGIRLCLGTDSLASVGSLSIQDEMAFTAQRFPLTSPETILQMATLGGAQALGLEHYMGSLIPGKSARLAFAPIQTTRAADVVESIIHSRGTHSIQLP